MSSINYGKMLSIGELNGYAVNLRKKPVRELTRNAQRNLVYAAKVMAQMLKQIFRRELCELESVEILRLAKLIRWSDIENVGEIEFEHHTTKKEITA